jgi:hypothetical protein
MEKTSQKKPSLVKLYTDAIAWIELLGGAVDDKKQEEQQVDKAAQRRCLDFVSDLHNFASLFQSAPLYKIDPDSMSDEKTLSMAGAAIGSIAQLRAAQPLGKKEQQDLKKLVLEVREKVYVYEAKQKPFSDLLAYEKHTQDLIGALGHHMLRSGAAPPPLEDIEIVTGMVCTLNANMNLIRRPGLKIRHVRFSEKARNALQKVWLDSFLELKPDDALVTEFTPFLYEHFLGLADLQRYLQLQPEESDNVPVHSVLARMATDEQAAFIHDKVNNVDLRTIFRDKKHVFHQLLCLKVLAKKMLDENGVQWLKNHYLSPYNFWKEGSTKLLAEQKYNRPRYPVGFWCENTLCLDIDQSVMLTVSDAKDVFLAWLAVVDLRFKGVSEESKSLKKLIRSVLEKDGEDLENVKKALK